MARGYCKTGWAAPLLQQRSIHSSCSSHSRYMRWQNLDVQYLYNNRHLFLFLLPRSRTFPAVQPWQACAMRLNSQAPQIEMDAVIFGVGLPKRDNPRLHPVCATKLYQGLHHTLWKGQMLSLLPVPSFQPNTCGCRVSFDCREAVEWKSALELLEAIQTNWF